MKLEELLEHFNNGDTLGEDFEVIKLMRYYCREAQKIMLEINTRWSAGFRRSSSKGSMNEKQELYRSAAQRIKAA